MDFGGAVPLIAKAVLGGMLFFYFPFNSVNYNNFIAKYSFIIFLGLNGKCFGFLPISFFAFPHIIINYIVMRYNKGIIFFTNTIKPRNPTKIIAYTRNNLP